jgi:S1-C subfamily serine protease
MPSLSCTRLVFLVTLLLGSAQFSRAETLTITSNPAGATVEIDGVLAGTTPFEKNFPGGYFHRTLTAVGSRLEHPMVVRVSLVGYATREIALTEGPMEWIDLHGRHHGAYWLFKSDHFQAELNSIASTFTGTVSSAAVAQPAGFELSLEEIVRRTKPAVVCLKGFDSSGSGFFVTETGVIATNAHVARGDSTLLALLPSGVQLEAKVVYIDPDLDIALAKVAAPSAGFVFPHLALADATAVRQGESVLAIGNPGDAMLFSVTKGIVSAVGKFATAGPGTWVQTDAPINPGNSGGPLVNERGEVIGLNTLKLIKKNVTGIGFALSSTDLLSVLRRFYPTLAPPAIAAAAGSARKVELSADVSSETLEESAVAPAGVTIAASAPGGSGPEGSGQVTLTSEPDAAEIYVDGKFMGNTPAALKLAAGSHSFLLKLPGFTDYARALELPRSSKLSVKAVFKSLSQP